RRSACFSVAFSRFPCSSGETVQTTTAVAPTNAAMIWANSLREYVEPGSGAVLSAKSTSSAARRRGIGSPQIGMGSVGLCPRPPHVGKRGRVEAPGGTVPSTGDVLLRLGEALWHQVHPAPAPDKVVAQLGQGLPVGVAQLVHRRRRSRSP